MLFRSVRRLEWIWGEFPPQVGLRVADIGLRLWTQCLTWGNPWRTMEAIHQIVYGSRVAEPFAKEQLLGLLEQSRRKNQEKRLSGLLLYRDGQFLQVLEGPEKPVKELFAKIRQDPRHHEIEVYFEGQVAGRMFPDWSMGFRDLDDPTLLRNLAYSEFMNQPPEPRQGGSRSAALFAYLERFRSEP